MELNTLESIFFNEILNAELDVPVHATLTYEGNPFDIIVVPEIAPEGYFRLKYFNAPAYEPEPQVSDDGVSYRSFTIEEMFGSHPLLERAWRKHATVELQLNPSQSPIQPKLNPSLEAKVMYAGVGNRGELVLDQNQVILSAAPLKKAEFSISDFCDFLLPATSPRRVVLDSDDGWKITLTKDENAARDTVSHTGVVEKNSGDDFGIDELGDVLEGIRYFFAFVEGAYRFPTVVIGYDDNVRVTWGEVGKFESDRRHTPNWFRHSGEAPWGRILEQVFPMFWRRWIDHKDELMAVIDCYAVSNKMRRAGLQQDAVAKSCFGLEILASLVLEKTIQYPDITAEEIYKVLRCYHIHNRNLNPSDNPSTEQLRRNLSLSGNTGSGLIVTVRNYVAHPLHKKTVEVRPQYLQHLDSDIIQYVYLHDLSQFYLEYMLLRFCGLIVPNYRRLLEQQR